MKSGLNLWKGSALKALPNVKILFRRNVLLVGSKFLKRNSINAYKLGDDVSVN